MNSLPTEEEVQSACKAMRRRVMAVNYAAEVFTQAAWTGWGGSRLPSREVHVRFVKNGKTVFTIWAMSLERVQAHWETFLVSNNALAPKVGGRVRVSCGPGRDYTAKALEVTKTRVLCQWRYVAGHKSAPRWFRICDIWW